MSVKHGWNVYFKSGRFNATAGTATHSAFDLIANIIMVTWTIFKQPYLWPLVLLIAADSLIIATSGPPTRYAAALTLLLFLPGWVWVEAFFNPLLNLAERLVLAIGLSLALTVFGAMLAAYLPGPISEAKLLVITNSITLVGLGVVWYQNYQQRQSTNQHPLKHNPLLFTNYQFLLTLLLLILLAAALRLPRLGYAEFHEDEAEALLLGTRLFQGEDYALFLHRKGPAQMLLPVSFWLLTNRLTEALARFPFALNSILSVVTLFFIGRRWFGLWPGAIAAGLWAINGYAIAFGRMVQYQALIFFLVPLALYCLYLAWQLGRMRFYIAGVVLLAAGLLAHFDALLLLPAAAYLTWLVLSRGAEGQEGKRKNSSPPHPYLLNSKIAAIILALTLFVGLLASFYIPFVFDPEFQNTATYLAETRVKPGLLYNNLDLLRRLDRDYSSHFYLPLLALGIFSFVLLQGSRWQVASSKVAGRRSQGSKVADNKHALRTTHYALLLLSLTTLWLPDLWRVGPLNLALLPWLLLVGLSFWQADAPARAAWLMFAGGFIGYGFLVDDPRTHFYIMYPGALLLAGAGWSMLNKRMGAWAHGRIANKSPLLPCSSAPLPIIAGLLLAGLIIAYEAALFLPTESTFARLRAQWDGSIWESIYNDIPTPREYFGYPKREGWKAIGALRTRGHFPGDFRSVNEDFVIPIWYNYGQARSCYDTPAQFFVRLQGLETAPISAYHLTGQIAREGEVRLQIYSAGSAGNESPETTEPYTLENLAYQFDQQATPRRFAQQNEPTQPVNTQFGPAMQFVGFDLPTPAVAPGDTLRVNLYWLALDNPGQNYRAFAHLTDGATLWSQQDDTPACRLPTSIWRAGQRGLGQFRLRIPPDMPPGRYPLIIGLYQADTLERLQITAGAGKIGDDFLWLADVEVVAAD